MENKSFNPFEFLTTPWGNLPIGSSFSAAQGFNPGDLRELDKRIAELKAVEQWLSLNTSLLKTTIQGLEVQRGTLAAIQSFSESMASPQTKPGDAKPSQGFGTEQAALWWDTMQQQFSQMMTAAQAGAQAMTQPAKPAKKSKSQGDQAT